MPPRRRALDGVSPTNVLEAFATFNGNMQDRMSDVEGRIVEVSSKLDMHIVDVHEQRAKVDQMHTALFHPIDGLVNVKRWMCRIATWTATIFGGVLAAAAAGASFGHSLGWW